MVAFDGTVTLPEGARGLRLKPMNNYWLGEDSVTQSQWKSVMHNNPSIDQKSLINPVDNITWEEAKAFCEWLNGNSDILRPPGYRFDLPTKAQCNSIDGNEGEWFLEMPHVPNVRRPGIHFRLALVPENP